MEENFVPLLQQFIEQGQAQVLSNLEAAGEEGSSADLPEVVSNAIAAEPSGLQELIAQGQSAVFANLDQDTAGAINEDVIGSFSGVGTNTGDAVTDAGAADSSVPGVAVNFVSAEAGTVDPATGSEIFGQVELTAGGESTPLFTLGASGPVNPVSADGQLDFSAFVPSFISANQPVGDTSAI